MTTESTTAEIPELNREISVCKQTQSWSPSSIRTSWVGSLEAIRDATTDEDLAAAIDAAATEARRLATIIAQRLVDPDEIRERLYADLTAEQDDEIRDMTVAELVGWMRENDVTIDDATAGERDGYEITTRGARAYASCRSWRGCEDYDFVEIDLLAVEDDHA